MPGRPDQAGFSPNVRAASRSQSSASERDRNFRIAVGFAPLTTCTLSMPWRQVNLSMDHPLPTVFWAELSGG